MHRVVDIQRFTGIGKTRHTLAGLFEHARDGHRSPHAILVIRNGSGFDAEQLPDHTGENCRRAAGLATCNCGDRLFLVRRCAVVYDQPHRPIAFAHDIGSVTDDGETQAVQFYAVGISLIDVEHHREIAPRLGWLSCHICRYARTHIITTARFKIIAGHLPRCHEKPPCVWIKTAKPSPNYATLSPARSIIAKVTHSWDFWKICSFIDYTGEADWARSIT